MHVPGPSGPAAAAHMGIGVNHCSLPIGLREKSHISFRVELRKKALVPIFDVHVHKVAAVAVFIPLLLCHLHLLYKAQHDRTICPARSLLTRSTAFRGRFSYYYSGFYCNRTIHRGSFHRPADNEIDGFLRHLTKRINDRGKRRRNHLSENHAIHPND